MYDAEGVTRIITQDISCLYPEGRSVAELDKLPDAQILMATGSLKIIKFLNDCQGTRR